MARPYWSGNLQISFNSFGIKLFPATGAGSEINFPRISSRHSLEVVQFVDEGEISPAYFEKPYFVTPKDANAAEAFAVVRSALQEAKNVALGKIAVGGREYLVTISSPPEGEERLPGMMAYTMRYADELRSSADYFSDIKKVSVDEDQPSLAKELIKRKTAKFAPERFKDEYEVALREMVAARIDNELIPHDEPAKKPGKVVILMDALRKSVENGPTAAPKTNSHEAAIVDPKKGLSLVKPSTSRTLRPKRKSA